MKLDLQESKEWDGASHFNRSHTFSNLCGQKKDSYAVKSNQDLKIKTLRGLHCSSSIHRLERENKSYRQSRKKCIILK